METIISTDESIGHILMTDLFSGFTLSATPPSMDLCTVIDTFFSHWVVRQHGDGFGLPSNYVYTSSGHLMDTREGKNLCNFTRSASRDDICKDKTSY